MKRIKKIGFILSILSIFSCTNDRVFPDVNTELPIDGDYTLIHYWNFNDATDLIKPTYSVSSASIEYKGARYDAVEEGSKLNARNNDLEGSALRLRNPSGDFILNMPTSGFDDVIFSYSTTRTSNGPLVQHVYYSLDGTTFTQSGLVDANYSVSETFIFHSLNFKAIEGANNNPNFKIKVVFESNIEGDSGNSRFDNITLDGVKSSEPPVVDIKTEEVFQYWNFNNKDDLAKPNVGNGSWVFLGDRFDSVDGTTLNAQNSDIASTALRLRNPSGDFILTLPTAGYEKLTLKFAVQRSNTGATNMDVSYSVNGTTYSQDNLTTKNFIVPAEDTSAANLGYAIVTIDLTNIVAVNNNDLLKIKISSVATSGGNSRFDNITLSGFKL